MFEHFYTLLLTLLILSPFSCDARRASQSGGFSNRGQSASRGGVASGGSSGNQGGFHPNTNQGGFRPNQNQGGFHPNNNQGGFHPNPSQGGFHPNTNTGFRSGSGIGSQASSGTFKKALIGGALGAAGGILAYEAGKAIIRSATEPFNYNGRNYNWDNNGRVRAGEFQCSMPLSQLTGQTGTPTTTTTTIAPASTDGASTTTVPSVNTTMSPDQVLQTVQYSNGERPKTIVWACKAQVEQCCGTDCCPVPVQNNSNSRGTSSTIGSVVLIIFLIMLLLCCGCCVGAYFCCRSVFDCFKSDGRKSDEDYNEEYKNQQNYQMQNYAQPQPGYQQPYQQNTYQQPQSQGYPPSGNYYPPAQYPQNPNY